MDIYDSITTNLDTLINSISDSDIIIIEGFESIGKKFLIDTLKSSLESYKEYENMYLSQNYKCIVYRPDYDKINYGESVDLSKRFILRIPILEFFEEIKRNFSNNDIQLILDKSVFSDAVYCLLNADDGSYNIIKMLSTYNGLVKDYKIAVVHMTAFSEDPANLVNSDEILGKFSNYQEYFKQLSFADKLFGEMYQTYLSLFSNKNIKFIKYYYGGIS